MTTAESVGSTPPSRQPRRWLAPAATAAVILTVTGGIGIAGRAGDASHRTPRPDVPPSRASAGRPPQLPGAANAKGAAQPCRATNAAVDAPQRPARDTNASGWLRRTEATLVTTPADTQTGPVTYIRLHE